jgi:hypothetical protein
MEQEPKPKNLYQRISAVMADVEYLQKDDNVGSGNYGYKAISIEKVTEAVRTAMVRHGLVILPIEQVHVMEDKERANNNGQRVLVPITTVDVKYKIVNVDNPAEFETIVSSGTGVDPQDKGVGKAMLYSYKNLLLRTFAIPTGDDTDKTHNKELEAQQKPIKAAKQEPQPEQPKPMAKEQKAEILELLKNPAQTQDIVTKVTTDMAKYDIKAADQAIRFLKKKIAEKAVETAKLKVS